MSFTPIETQEDLDKIISARLERAEKQHSEQMKKLEEERDGFSNQLEGLNKTIDELKAKSQTDANTIAEKERALKEYATRAVKTGIAREFGLPDTLADRLAGEDEDAIREDAKALADTIKASRPKAPMPRTAPASGGSDAKTEALRQMVESLHQND